MSEEIEELSSEVHDLYQNEVKRQGRELRHEDSYESLPEITKELDRVFVRWHLERVAKWKVLAGELFQFVLRLEEGCSFPSNDVERAIRDEARKFCLKAREAGL